jgi:hypothetical protein
MLEDLRPVQTTDSRLGHIGLTPDAGGPPSRTNPGLTSVVASVVASVVTSVATSGAAHSASQNEPAQIFVLGKGLEPLADEGLVDDDVLVGPIRGVEAQVFEHALENGMEPAGADILG